MSFILSSPAAAPAPAASPGHRAATRSADQDVEQPGSFGEAMARARESGPEKTAEFAVQPASRKTVRHLDEAEKPPVQDTVNQMTALLIPLESRLVAAAQPGAAPAAKNPVAPAVTASLGDPLAALSASASASAPVTQDRVNPKTALLVPLENRLVAAALPGAAPAAENPVAAVTASLGDPLAAAPVTPAGLAFVLAPAGVKNAERGPVPARDAAVSNDTATAADPRALAAQADAASASLSDPSSGHGEQPMNLKSARAEEGAELSLDSSDTLSVAGTSPWLPPAGAAPQQAGSMSAPNAPTPVASALLAPDIGSSQWGKALDQQVIHLSTADQQVAELQLNPPGLGPLKVTLSFIDQQMQAAFVSAHSSVRAAVEAALPQLRVQLAESGISLGQTSVGAESQPQTAFANGQSDFGRQSPHPGYRARDADTAALFSAQPIAVQRRPGQGLRIDTYA